MGDHTQTSRPHITKRVERGGLYSKEKGALRRMGLTADATQRQRLRASSDAPCHAKGFRGRPSLKPPSFYF